MKRSFPALLIAALFIFLQVQGQNVKTGLYRELERLFGRLMTGVVTSNKLAINDSICTLIDGYSRSDSIFRHKFDSIRYLGQVTSPDKSLKILTWNLLTDSTTGRYYCYLVKKGEKGKPNTVCRLSAIYREEAVRTDTVYTSKDWYGALYYDIRLVKSEGKKYWMLLGLDYGNPLITRKIIDVLSFTPGDMPVFGMRWFDDGTEIKYREVFQYSSEGTMTLRFISDKSIIFDHLVPFSADRKNDRRYYGAEFSYDNYIYKNNIWKLKLNVDVRNKK
jgi:hypothetical protein